MSLSEDLWGGSESDAEQTHFTPTTEMHSSSGAEELHIHHILGVTFTSLWTIPALKSIKTNRVQEAANY